MRNWINLVTESVSPLLSEVDAAAKYHLGMGISNNNEEAEAWYGTSDPEKLVSIVNDDIEHLFSSGSAVLHRILNIPDNLIEKLKPGETLGPSDENKPASWTTAWQEIQFDAIQSYLVHDTDNFIVVEARVPFSAVDVPLTIAQNICMHWEKEITLLRHTPITLLGIWRAEQYGGTGEQLRTDLVGAKMLS